MSAAQFCFQPDIYPDIPSQRIVLVFRIIMWHIYSKEEFDAPKGTAAIARQRLFKRATKTEPLPSKHTHIKTNKLCGP
jgi:hypothetical protein